MKRWLIALVVTGASVLAACAPTVHEACVSYGFEPGTTAYSNCRMTVAAQRAQRREEAIRNYLLYRGQQPTTGTVVSPGTVTYPPGGGVLVQP